MVLRAVEVGADQTQRRVHLAQFIATETPGRLRQTLRIHDARLLGDVPGRAPVDEHLSTKCGVLHAVGH